MSILDLKKSTVVPMARNCSGLGHHGVYVDQDWRLGAGSGFSVVPARRLGAGLGFSVACLGAGLGLVFLMVSTETSASASGLICLAWC